ncbi:MAG: aminopeptidase N, partial [Sinobacterium sp.]|nr:aminopeptidase N [Sinobacterium sp.]
AMENKGLNIFNTSCVLAHSDTTTDAGFQRVEAVVAHEYFHNWSGNRVTCRDWFQLSLKEGFTVYRDSEFSADMNSRSVKRIEDANFLRAHQFVEDAGPMAHAIRPASFIEISNFYTLTIYEKGAEVVRMLANLLGPKKFRAATDLYFSRHDGEAATCEDFVRAMEDSAGINLTQFRRWYDQAGTPQLNISDSYDEAAQQYSLTIKQHTPNTPGQQNKQPLHIPIKIALLGSAGHFALRLENEAPFIDSDDNTQRVLDVLEAEQTFVFTHISEPPVPSLLREFSAPVNFSFDYSDDQLLDLLARDDDGFSRFNAAQSIFTDWVRRDLQGENINSSIQPLADVYQQLLSDEQQDPALLALLITLPAQAYLLEQLKPANPLHIYAACQRIKKKLATLLAPNLLPLLNHINETLERLAQEGLELSGQSMGLRSLKHAAFELLSDLDGDNAQQAAFSSVVLKQFDAAINMTETLAALKCLVAMPLCAERAQLALASFYQRFQDESLVVNMWFQLQASQQTLDQVKDLMHHKAFDFNNPNKLRALVGGFCGQNTPAFHNKDGSGYEFLADQIIRLNLSNPQIASRMVAPLTHWKKIEGEQGKLMRSALQRIADADKLSKDVYEVVSKSLAEAS